jgi:tetratricopeptide (TPR) repeat protein
MATPSNKLSQFWKELKRRNVVRVITVYTGAAFVILSLIDMIREPFELPNWSFKLIIVILLVGLIIAVIISWIYDIHPEGGMIKTEPADRAKTKDVPKSSNRWKTATYVSVLVIIGLILYHIFGTKRSIDLSGLDNTIAVLPIEYLGQDESTNSLIDVFPIALISELQQVEDFTIMHWGSSRNYSAKEYRSIQIGEELHVNFLLTGYLVQQGKDVEVYFTLIVAATDETIWNAAYTIETEDALRVRRKIAKQVAKALENTFDPEQQYLSENPDAELAYFTGLDYYWMDDFKLSIRYLERAVELDPGFIQARTKLASAHFWMYQYQFDRSQERLQKALDALEQVRAADPGNPDILLAEGVYYYVTHDYPQAMEKYKMAEGRVSDAPELYSNMAAVYRRQQNLGKALEYWLKAEALSPQNVLFILELGETYMLLREYEQAEEYFRKLDLLGYTKYGSLVDDVYLYLLWEKGNVKSREALQGQKELSMSRSYGLLTFKEVHIELIDRNFNAAIEALNSEPADSIHHQLIYRPKTLSYAEVYALQNKPELANRYYDSARVHLEAKISETPQDSRCYSSLGITWAGMGKKDEAIRAGQTAVDLMPITKDFYRGIFRLEDLARIYTMVGEYDKAIEILDQLLSKPGLISVNLLKKDPTWQNLWNRDEFNKMLNDHF